jgi:hypothetical protein
VKTGKLVDLIDQPLFRGQEGHKGVRSRVRVGLMLNFGVQGVELLSKFCCMWDRCFNNDRLKGIILLIMSSDCH